MSLYSLGFEPLCLHPNQRRSVPVPERSFVGGLYTAFQYWMMVFMYDFVGRVASRSIVKGQPRFHCEASPGRYPFENVDLRRETGCSRLLQLLS